MRWARAYTLRLAAAACVLALAALLVFSLMLPKPNLARERRDRELRELESRIDQALADADDERYWALRAEWWSLAHEEVKASTDDPAAGPRKNARSAGAGN
jgi:hypothetical protein